MTVNPTTHAPGRPRVPDVIPLIRALYARPGGGVGCCLHVMLDDGNLDDGIADFCVEMAVEQGHADCEKLARMLRQMTRSQRGRAARAARP